MPTPGTTSGSLTSNLKRYDDAIEAYRQALRINPENADAWNNLGIAYNNLKRYDDAIEAYRQALRINPEYANAWYNLGIAYPFPATGQPPWMPSGNCDASIRNRPTNFST